MLTRLCPKCGQSISYATRSAFNRAERTKPKCTVCYLRTVYGITLEEKEQMLVAQGGKCANLRCRRLLVDVAHACTDHDHATDKVRALLCNQCNFALGLLQDDRDAILGLAEYLERHENRGVPMERNDNRGKWVRPAQGIVS